MKRHSALWFLLGLGSEMQIIASLSFTELFALIAGPILFIRYHQQMRRDGVLPFFCLSLCVFLGCVIACFANQTPFQSALRGYAVTSIIPCAIIVSHWMIRRDPNGFKWFLLGVTLSIVLCTFVFQKSVELVSSSAGAAGGKAAEAIMEGPIFWISRLKGFVLLLTQGWYLHTPIIWDVPAALFVSAFALLTTVSGRSAALSSLAFVVVLLIGGKRLYTMHERLCKRFWLLAVMAVIGIFLAKGGYETAANSGWLGEDARKKYETQTRGDTSLMALLLGGRMEAFCGLIACVEKPLVGFGPWAIDDGRYVERFLMKYGKQEDIDALMRMALANPSAIRLIPCHAYITEFWLWFGIFGLLFWLYVLFVLFRYLKQDCWAIPQWFAWLACSIPGYFWSVFFSPLANRFTPILFVVACLMARAVRQGRFQLPYAMVREIEENERKRK